MKALIGIVAASALMLASGYAAAGGGQALAQKSGCMTCHAVDHKVLGPAFKDVAAKFKSDKTAVADLERFIKHGGGAMPPQSQLKDADVKALAKWIKGL
jgi:cytochrome c